MHIDLYNTFKSVVKHRRLSYGYPRGQTSPPSRGNHTRTYITVIEYMIICNDFFHDEMIDVRVSQSRYCDYHCSLFRLFSR